MKIEERSGKYRIRVYMGRDETGKRKYRSVTADTKTAVKHKAQEILNSRERDAKLIYMTVGEAIDKYIRLKDNILSPTSIKSYKSIRKHNLQSLMDIPIYELTNEKVQLAVNIEALTHSPKTVHNAHGLLSTALGVYRPDFTLHTTLPKKIKRERYIPTTEDVSRLLNLTEGTEMYIPVLLAATLSLRRSEVCALTWDDVNFKNNTLTVRHAKVYTDKNMWVIKDPKTYNSFRTLDMPPILASNLKLQEKIDKYIVPFTPGALSCRFNKIIKRNGFEKFSFHSLRHYNASVMLALNLPDKYAMERGGWATPYTMKNIYQHTFKSEQAKYDKMLSDYFNRLYSN